MFAGLSWPDWIKAVHPLMLISGWSLMQCFTFSSLVCAHAGHVATVKTNKYKIVRVVFPPLGSGHAGNRSGRCMWRLSLRQVKNILKLLLRTMGGSVADPCKLVDVTRWRVSF